MSNFEDMIIDYGYSDEMNYLDSMRMGCLKKNQNVHLIQKYS